jgi:multidrug resistance efflux pump
METSAPRDPGMPLEERPATASGPASPRADEAEDRPSPLGSVARVGPIPDDRSRHDPTAPDQSPAVRRGSPARWIGPLSRWLATLAIVALAAVATLTTWDYYVDAPWTRDGRVRVQVASVAPQVSGKIVDLRVSDNQFVHRGDVLYVIDPFDFRVAVRTASASLRQRAADLQVKEVQSARRQRLTDLAASVEEQQIFAGTAVQARAAFEAAQQQVDQAEINLRRTEVRSPVNGYVTNLLLSPGDYAQQGVTNVSIIDIDSYWIDGYFEETKMARVCVGDRVEAKLMGYAQPIVGHVATVTRGIGVSDASPGVQGLPSVDPVYTWVRLAQRVPVRVAIDKVPPGVPLVAGMTATVTVLDTAEADGGGWFGHAIAAVGARISDAFNGRQTRTGCIPAVMTGHGETQSLPIEEERPGLSPQQIDPGLAPGMRTSPRNP